MSGRGQVTPGACVGPSSCARTTTDPTTGETVCVDAKGGLAQSFCANDPSRVCQPTRTGVLTRVGRAEAPRDASGMAYGAGGYPKRSDTVSVATFCEAATGTSTVDILTGLPGPGARSFPHRRNGCGMIDQRVPAPRRPPAKPGALHSPLACARPRAPRAEVESRGGLLATCPRTPAPRDRRIVTPDVVTKRPEATMTNPGDDIYGSQEHRAFRETVRKFIQTELTPRARESTSSHFDKSLYPNGRARAARHPLRPEYSGPASTTPTAIFSRLTLCDNAGVHGHVQTHGHPGAARSGARS
jgi:hypothetical protein